MGRRRPYYPPREAYSDWRSFVFFRGAQVVGDLITWSRRGRIG